MEIVSFARSGYEGEIIKVEADLRRGIPAIDIVGLPDGAVREARERMRAAIRNSGLDFPRERILINLSPADLRKEGSSFDLPIALAVLAAAGGNSDGPGEKAADSGDRGKFAEPLMILGELELSGAVRPVRGILSAVSRGLARGIRYFMVPGANAEEAAIRGEARVIGVNTLTEAVFQLRSIGHTRQAEADGQKCATENRGAGYRGAVYQGAGYRPVWPAFTEGYEDVRGQNVLVRALQIAAAGGHNLIAHGPPGCGKTLALRRFPTLLPELDEGTAVTVTRIHSIAGTLTGGTGALVRTPPFREPHPNASLEGMVGGGRLCHPGEISLAHGGALFLDEAAQFRSSALQALRAPLETGEVTVSRAGKTDTFPARFQLLMAVNPCPCGNYGTAGRICTCPPDAVEKYWKKMTSPLLDRIDLRVAVDLPDGKDLIGEQPFSTDELRKEIGRARIIQWKRNGGEAGEHWLNANLGNAAIGRVCALHPAIEGLLVRCVEQSHLSGRGTHSVLKVARTIADLAGAERIEEDHLLEAVQLRRWKGVVPDFL